jgi:hypothetical protein
MNKKHMTMIVLSDNTVDNIGDYKVVWLMMNEILIPFILKL